MASEQYLVDTIADRVLHILIGKAGPEDTLDREVRWAMQSAQLIFTNDVNPHSFRAAFSVTTTADENTYALPDDFHQIIDDTVRMDPTDQALTRLIEIPLQMFHRYQMEATLETGTPSSYRIVNKDKTTGSWQIFFHPTPDEDGLIVLGDYRSLPDPVWNSTRGSGQVLDLRFAPENLPLFVSGCIACGHFSRYLSQQDLAAHMMTWEKGLAVAKKNNNPVVGKAYQRHQTPGRTMRVPGGVWPSHDAYFGGGGVVT